MNIRNQILKLRQQTGLTQFNRNVRAISALMDELHAAAVGVHTRENVSLLEILNETPDQNRPNHGQSIKR